MIDVRFKNEKQWRDGKQISFEIKEWIDTKDGRVVKDECVCNDFDYYKYISLRETYARGQITDDQLAFIINGDNLRRFCKDGDFVREVMDSAVMDARIAKSKEFETKWQAAIMACKKYPQARDQIYNEVLGNIFKDL